MVCGAGEPQVSEPKDTTGMNQSNPGSWQPSHPNFPTLFAPHGGGEHSPGGLWDSFSGADLGSFSGRGAGLPFSSKR